MIVQENIGENLVRTYSDVNHYIIQDGTNIKYYDAVDPINSGRTYTESDEELPVEDSEEENDDI